MKFLVPNYSCLQNTWLGGYRPQIPVLSVLCPQLNLLNPPKKFLGTPLMVKEDIWSLMGIKSPLFTSYPVDKQIYCQQMYVLYAVSSCNISETTLALQVNLLRLTTYTLIILRDNWHINYNTRRPRHTNTGVTPEDSYPFGTKKNDCVLSR